MCLGQLLVPVGRQPDFSQRPTFAEDKVCVKHRLDAFSPQGKGEVGDASGLERKKKKQREKQYSAHDWNHHYEGVNYVGMLKRKKLIGLVNQFAQFARCKLINWDFLKPLPVIGAVPVSHRVQIQTADAYHLTCMHKIQRRQRMSCSFYRSHLHPSARQFFFC